VFYHPMLIFQKVLSWADLEYININQFCSYSVELMQQCYNQKEDFSNQIDETIQFIKNGHYSIEDQFNLNLLYQRWERFGQKLISIIFPIKSQMKGFNNQEPYSYAIIMTARVITDRSDHLKLFNLLNVNYLRIPLIVEFIV
ncbi:tetratricopeptide repeat protein, partial (macronuclear) [Tetrahymena thermophila SB210]